MGVILWDLYVCFCFFCGYFYLMEVILQQNRQICVYGLIVMVFGYYLDYYGYILGVIRSFRKLK